MARKKKEVDPAAVVKKEPKQPKVTVQFCDIHGEYITNPAEVPVCPCCTCDYGEIKFDRDIDENFKKREYRYIILDEVESPLLAGQKDELIVVPVIDSDKYIAVEFHNGMMLCPCKCCHRDVQLMERYGEENIESELEFERNVDILMNGYNQIGDFDVE